MLDVLIRGATVFPGDAPSFVGDIGVSRGVIDLVTLCHKDAGTVEAQEVLDADGLIPCPGSATSTPHSALQSSEDRLLTPKLAQGFPTDVINPGCAQKGGAPGTLRTIADGAARTRITRDIDDGAAGLGEHPGRCRARTADLVLLDPARYATRPHVPIRGEGRRGVVGVWVNGVRAWKHGGPNGARPGCS